MQDAEAVGGRHRPGRADGDGLLAEPVVEGPGHLALPVEVHRALLDRAHEQHRAQQADPVVRGQVRGWALRGGWCWDRSERPCCWSPSSPFVSAVEDGISASPFRHLVGISARDANRPGRGYRVRTLVAMAEIGTRLARGGAAAPALAAARRLAVADVRRRDAAGDGAAALAADRRRGQRLDRGAAAGGLPERHRDRAARRARRRRCCAAARRDLPKVVADDYAGLGGARRRRRWRSSSPGSCTAPSSHAEREAFARAVAGRRGCGSQANGDDFARAHVDAADTRAGRPRPVPHLRARDRTPSAGCASSSTRRTAPPRVRRDREPRIQRLTKSARGLQVGAASCR